MIPEEIFLGNIERASIARYDIELRRIADFNTKDEIQLPSVLEDIAEDDSQLTEVFFPGTGVVYFPVDLGEQDNFRDRLDTLAEKGFDGFQPNVAYVDKRTLNEMLRNCEISKKSEDFDTYIRRYNKPYTLVIVPVNGDGTCRVI